MQLEYFVNGESNKETILFVHGAGANAGQFEKQHDFFSEKSILPLLPDTQLKARKPKKRCFRCF